MRHHRTTTAGAALVLALALTLAAPSHADAQTATGAWSADARTGIALPVGPLGSMDLVDAGPSFGLGLAYRVHPRFSVRADADLDLFGGADFDSETATQSGAPDLALWHLSGALEYDVLRPDEGRWDLTVHGGGGVTTLDSHPFVDGPITNPRTREVEAAFLATYFTVSGGLKAGYAVSRKATVYAGFQWHWSLADQEETAVFDALDPPELWAFREVHSIPLTFGFRMDL